MNEPWSDPVVEEVRSRGRAYSTRFGHQIQEIFKDLNRHQELHLHRYVCQVSHPGQAHPSRSDEKL